MDEKDIQILLTLAEHQNLTRTAERLYMTQPALTSRIQRLEKDLNAQLLQRSAKGVSFTPAGQIAVEFAKSCSINFRKLREQIRAEHGMIQGTLHLGCSTQYAKACLPAILAEFIRLYPSISVDVVVDRSINIQNELNRGRFPLAVSRGNCLWRGYKIPLSTESYWLVCKDADARANLSEVPYIHQKIDLQGSEQADEWVRNNLDFHPKAIVESNSLDVCVSLVSMGLGWAILPEICLGDFHGYREKICSVDGQPILRNTFLCYKESECTLPHIQAFIRYMKMIHGLADDA